MKCNFLTAGSSWVYSAKAGWFSVFDSQGFILMCLYLHMFMYTCVWKPEDNLRNIIYLLWDSVSLLVWSLLVNTSMACQQTPNVLLFTLPSSGITNRTLLNAFKNEFWKSSSHVTHLRWAHYWLNHCQVPGVFIYNCVPFEILPLRVQKHLFHAYIQTHAHLSCFFWNLVMETSLDSSMLRSHVSVYGGCYLSNWHLTFSGIWPFVQVHCPW